MVLINYLHHHISSVTKLIVMFLLLVSFPLGSEEPVPWEHYLHDRSFVEWFNSININTINLLLEDFGLSIESDATLEPDSDLFHKVEMSLVWLVSDKIYFLLSYEYPELELYPTLYEIETSSETRKFVQTHVLLRH